MSCLLVRVLEHKPCEGEGHRMERTENGRSVGEGLFVGEIGRMAEW